MTSGGNFGCVLTVTIEMAGGGTAKERGGSRQGALVKEAREKTKKY